MEDVGAKAAVTPVGMPDAVNATEPANVPVSFTAIVLVPVAPWAIDSDVVDGVNVKPDGAAPQVVPLIANDAGTAFVAPFQVPLNPMPVKLPPAGMLPL